jgi:hypothetical protein
MPTFVSPARRAVRPARRLVLRLPRAHVVSETATHAPIAAFQIGLVGSIHGRFSSVGSVQKALRVKSQFSRGTQARRGAACRTAVHGGLLPPCNRARARGMCGITALPLRAKFSSATLSFAPYFFLQTEPVGHLRKTSGFADVKGGLDGRVVPRVPVVPAVLQSRRARMRGQRLTGSFEAAALTARCARSPGSCSPRRAPRRSAASRRWPARPCGAAAKP